jgi:hypothetical protein
MHNGYCYNFSDFSNFHFDGITAAAQFKLANGSQQR